MSGICKTTGKENAHKYCTPAEKVFSWEFRLTILILLYMYTGNDQLSKWMVEVRYLTVGVESYKYVRGRGYNDTCSDGLELDTSLRIQV